VPLIPKGAESGSSSVGIPTPSKWVLVLDDRHDDPRHTARKRAVRGDAPAWRADGNWCWSAGKGGEKDRGRGVTRTSERLYARVWGKNYSRSLRKREEKGNGLEKVSEFLVQARKRFRATKWA